MKLNECVTSTVFSDDLTLLMKSNMSKESYQLIRVSRLELVMQEIEIVVLNDRKREWVEKGVFVQTHGRRYERETRDRTKLEEDVLKAGRI